MMATTERDGWTITRRPHPTVRDTVKITARSGHRVIHRELRIADALGYDPEADWQAGLAADTKRAAALRRP